MTEFEQSDYMAIQSLLQAQFSSLSWDLNREADWQTFIAGFDSQARLFPAARPLKPISPQQFQQRMQHLKETSVLVSFSERITAYEIRIYGHIALAVVGCEMHENQQEYSHDISIITLVKQASSWSIVSQAWDSVTRQECYSL